MELSVLQENFTKALNNASRIATSRTQLPILNNILLRTDGNRLLVACYEYGSCNNALYRYKDY